MEIKNSIVAILSAKNKIVGTGFVAGVNLILTCTHVVEAASAGLDEQVTIRFEIDGSEAVALVEQNSLSPVYESDVTLLRVEALPPHVKPLPMDSASGSAGHNFYAYGYAIVTGVQGIGARGKIVAVVDNGRLVQLTSQEPDHGMSGGPVLDEQRNVVVGMVSKGKGLLEKDGNLRNTSTTFATAVDVIFKICRELAPVHNCPYRSLEVFFEADAPFFFGRQVLTTRLIDSLKSQPRFLAVLGPSGSGKSSLVQAGLVPAIRKGRLPGSARWDVLVFRPHDDPFEQLAASGLENPRAGLVDSVRRRLASAGLDTRLVLVIDQFEELLVNVPEDIRREFITELSALLDASVDVSVILTMRDDFYSIFQQIASALVRWQEHGTVNIPATLTADELREIMLAPARMVGLNFEEGLVEIIFKDAMETEGSARSTVLPLLEFTLTQLWEARRNGYLMRDTYRDLDGVSGGLTQWADRTYHTLDKDDRLLARSILTSLVHLGDPVLGLPDGRQRRVMADLGEDENVRRVVHLFADARLLAVWEDNVELIHDALIHEWSLLRGWLEQDRSLLVVQEEVRGAATKWLSRGRDESDLLHRGRRLHEVSQLLSLLHISPLESDYLQACTESERERSSLSLEVRVRFLPSQESDHIRPTLEIRIDRPREASGPNREMSAGSLHVTVRLDMLSLAGLQDDGPAYARLLTDLIFKERAFSDGFSSMLAEAREAARQEASPLVLQFEIDIEAPQAHEIVWELLCGPQEQLPLSLISENSFFLRQYANPNLRLRSSSSMRLLAVHARPEPGLWQSGESPSTDLDHLQLLRSELQEVDFTVLSAAEAGLSALHDALSGGMDVLHLVCPWRFETADVILWPASAAGVLEFNLQNLVELLLSLDKPPRLVVLESNLSTLGSEPGIQARHASFALLASRLAGAGVAAALLCPTNTPAGTRSRLLAVFLQELLKDGNIGRSITVARIALRSDPGWWQSILYSFNASGSFWYKPYLGGGQLISIFEPVLNAIRSMEITPVIGSGLPEPFLGSVASLAHKWALRYGIPSLQAQSFDLPQVAQFITMRSGPGFLLKAYRQDLQEEIVRRYSAALPPDLLAGSPWSATELSEALRKSLAFAEAAEHRISYDLLTSNPFPVYVTTTYDNLLAAALRNAGKDPQVRYFPWNDQLARNYPPYDEEPTPARPLVYHLLGNLDEPDSLVLNQDQYFDFLIGLAQNSRLIPISVRYHMAGHGLLFLGFREADLGFQLFLRYLDSFQGADLHKNYVNVMQAEPSTLRQTNSLLELKMEHYFCSVYWGSPDDFARELFARLRDLE